MKSLPDLRLDKRIFETMGSGTRHDVSIWAAYGLDALTFFHGQQELLLFSVFFMMSDHDLIAFIFDY